MKNITLAFAILLFTTITYSLSAQKSTPIAVTPLTKLSLEESNIQQLTPTLSYHGLRFGPYGWVHTGRWEVGLYLTPWISASNQVLSYYEKGGAMDYTTTYNYPGTNEGIFGTFVDVEPALLARRLGIVYIHGEIARQFQNGLRLGIGYTFSREPRPPKFTSADFPRNLGPNEFAFISRNRTQGRHINTHISYTFNRRKRLRPAIGINAVRQFFYGSERSISFYDGATGVATELDRISPQNSRSISYIFFLAQVSLQYQLTEHVSIGLETAAPVSNDILHQFPLVSMGGRYAFARGW